MGALDEALEALKDIGRKSARKIGDSSVNRSSRGAAETARRRAEALEAANRAARLNNQSTDSNNR